MIWSAFIALYDLLLPRERAVHLAQMGVLRETSLASFDLCLHVLLLRIPYISYTSIDSSSFGSFS
jgi:hypothetical protein